jgi:transcriptional regulator with XRE-family HTH domain
MTSLMSLSLDRLNAALASSGKSRADLARELDVARSTVGRWFSGEREPETVDVLKALAAALGTTAASLIDAEDVAANERERLLLKLARDASAQDREIALAILSRQQK